MIMMQIILVRHGEAENNLDNSRVGGWSDVRLTELGIRQVEAVAERLVHELEKPYKLYSSDLTRAKQTTEIICKTLGITPTYAMELREFNPGIVSGMNRKEATQYYNNVDTPDLDWRPYPESENFGEFYHRVISFMNILQTRKEDVLIIAHGGSIQNIIRWWLGLPLSTYFKVAFEIANTALTVLDYTIYNERRVERLNDTYHYARLNLINPIEGTKAYKKTEKTSEWERLASLC
jgi:probable phosphoglycerate mutase